MTPPYGGGATPVPQAGADAPTRTGHGRPAGQRLGQLICHQRTSRTRRSCSRGRSAKPVPACTPDVPVSSTSWSPSGSVDGTWNVIVTEPSSSATAAPSSPRLREGREAVTRSSGGKPVPVTVTSSRRRGAGSLIVAVAGSSTSVTAGCGSSTRYGNGEDGAGSGAPASTTCSYGSGTRAAAPGALTRPPVVSTPTVSARTAVRRVRRTDTVLLGRPGAGPGAGPLRCRSSQCRKSPMVNIR